MANPYKTLIMGIGLTVFSSFSAYLLLERPNLPEINRAVDRLRKRFPSIRFEPRLLEVGIACTIILLVAGIAIPNYFHARTAENEARVFKELRSINTALITYHTEHGVYPTSLEDVKDVVGNDVVDRFTISLEGGRKGYEVKYQPKIVNDEGRFVVSGYKMEATPKSSKDATFQAANGGPVTKSSSGKLDLVR